MVYINLKHDCMNNTSTKKNILSTPLLNNETELLNDFPFEPSNNVINKILNYSKALSIRKSKNIEFIEMVLN